MVYNYKIKKGEKMLKISLEVLVSVVRDPKEGKETGYVDFAFVGGLVSLPVSKEVLPALKQKEGQTILADFSVRAFSFVRFDRPGSAFELVNYLGMHQR